MDVLDKGEGEEMKELCVSVDPTEFELVDEVAEKVAETTGADSAEDLCTKASTLELISLISDKRDKEAFRRLHEMHREYVGKILYSNFRNAKRYHDDVMQMVWIRVWKKVHTFRGEAEFTSWLYRVISNTVFEFLRKDGRAVTPLFDGGDEEEQRVFDLFSVDSFDEGESEIWKKERSENLLKVVLLALDKMDNELLRKPLELCCFEGKSYVDAGLELGIPAGTVGSRVSRAKDVLKTILLSSFSKEMVDLGILEEAF